MALPGETIGPPEGRRRRQDAGGSLGADPHCPYCHKKLELQVCRSNAGYYIGTWCCCGPYSRESLRYWATREEAQAALDTNTWTPRG